MGRVFFDWHYYGNHLLEIPFVWQGGMAIQGGVVFGTLAGYWYLRKHNIDFWAFADIFAPASFWLNRLVVWLTYLTAMPLVILRAVIMAFSILKAR